MHILLQDIRKQYENTSMKILFNCMTADTILHCTQLQTQHKTKYRYLISTELKSSNKVDHVKAKVQKPSFSLSQVTGNSVV